jgi:ribosomal protein S8
MVLLNHKGYSSTFKEIALKMMKAKLKSKLPDKIQRKSAVSNLHKISYVIWAMLDVDEEAGNI